MRYWALGLGVTCAVMCAVFYGISSLLQDQTDRQNAIREKYACAKVVRISRDGTRVYRLKTGDFIVPAFGGSETVEDPVKVCAE